MECKKLTSPKILDPVGSVHDAVTLRWEGMCADAGESTKDSTKQLKLQTILDNQVLVSNVQSTMKKQSFIGI